MKAMIVLHPGPDGTLEQSEVPDPEPGFSDVVVRVEAAGVNNADLMVQAGFFGPEPRIPGHDVAGTVVALGDGVSDMAIGTRVILNSAVTCGRCEYCVSGNHGTCRQRCAIGQKRDGGYGEYVLIPRENVLELADDVAFETAAAIPSTHFTAWQMLHMRAGLKPGDTVLINAAAGGVGSAALEIARLSGARIIATVGGEVKRKAVLEWGADEAIDYNAQDVAEVVLELTKGCGVDIILDTIGASNWPASLKALKAGGRMVTCSVTGGRTPKLDIVDLLSRQLTILGAGGSGAKGAVLSVVSLLNDGKLKGHIDRVLAVRDAAIAQQAIRERTVIGKIILTPQWI